MTVVVKLGSSLVADGQGRVRRGLLGERAAEIGTLARAGEHVCVVSSGAIALGLRQLGVTRRPRATPRLQAASAVGQLRLQLAWVNALRAEQLQAAQLLLSAGDFAERATYLNVRNALMALLRLGIVPVVNENDATATDEITFGDNDALAAQVAVLVGARLLVLLTEVEGVYTSHPADPEAQLLAEGGSLEGIRLGSGSEHGRGGMESKIASARLAAAAGIPTVIASGRGPRVLTAIVAGETRGTRFAPTATPASAFRLWLRYAKPTRGSIVVDDGARVALTDHGRSLLAVGIVSCDGSFEPGDAVELVALDGTALGKGLVATGAAELRRRSRGVEAVHRDRLVLYERADAATRPGGRVTAPSDAEETSAAYFASTPDV
ncbi:MAG: glutamate 5-kinase [Gaiellaceae bacterium MAG52_C11]|nr:glutamate 5-kinase [Candidatus Gaiellasilicea maunaloa]